jgi:hypothetical protein
MRLRISKGGIARMRTVAAPVAPGSPVGNDRRSGRIILGRIRRHDELNSGRLTVRHVGWQRPVFAHSGRLESTLSGRCLSRRYVAIGLRRTFLCGHVSNNAFGDRVAESSLTSVQRPGLGEVVDRYSALWTR